MFARLDAAHAAPNGGEKIIVAAGVPVEDPGEERQGEMRHARPALVLDLVEKADDLGSLDGVDLAGAERRVDGPLERGLGPLGGTQLVTLALEILLGDGLERVGGRAFLPAPLGHRVAPLGDGADHRLGLFAGFAEPQAGLERHAPALAGRPILHDVALFAGWQHQQAEAALFGIPDDDVSAGLLLVLGGVLVVLDAGRGDIPHKSGRELLPHADVSRAESALKAQHWYMHGNGRKQRELKNNDGSMIFEMMEAERNPRKLAEAKFTLMARTCWRARAPTFRPGWLTIPICTGPVTAQCLRAYRKSCGGPFARASSRAARKKTRSQRSPQGGSRA